MNGYRSCPGSLIFFFFCLKQESGTNNRYAYARAYDLLSAIYAVAYLTIYLTLAPTIPTAIPISLGKLVDINRYDSAKASLKWTLIGVRSRLVESYKLLKREVYLEKLSRMRRPAELLSIDRLTSLPLSIDRNAYWQVAY